MPITSKPPYGVVAIDPTITDLFCLLKFLKNTGDMYVIASLQQDWTWEDNFENFKSYYQSAMSSGAIEEIPLPKGIEYTINSRIDFLEGYDCYILSNLNDGFLWLLAFEVSGSQEIFVFPKKPSEEIFLQLAKERFNLLAQILRKTNYEFIIEYFKKEFADEGYIMIANICSMRSDSTAIILTKEIDFLKLIKENLHIKDLVDFDIELYRFPNESH